MFFTLTPVAEPFLGIPGGTTGVQKESNCKMTERSNDMDLVFFKGASSNIEHSSGSKAQAEPLHTLNPKPIGYIPTTVTSWR